MEDRTRSQTAAAAAAGGAITTAASEQAKDAVVATVADSDANADKKADNTSDLSAIRETYKFITYSGNHAEFVAQALIRRGNFEQVRRETEGDLEGLSLVWRPVQFGSKTLSEIERINAGRRFLSPLVLGPRNHG